MFYLIFLIAVIIMILTFFTFGNALSKIYTIFLALSTTIKTMIKKFILALFASSVLVNLRFPLRFKYENSTSNVLKALFDIFFWFIIVFTLIHFLTRTKKEK